MNSRQRIKMVLDHQIPDRVPLDLGATPVTGMHVSSVYLLRQALGLDQPGEPVKVTNIYQMLGEIAPDLLDVLGVDTVTISKAANSFGISNEGWKEWATFDGTPVLVPGGFNTEVEQNGDLLIYPQGDQTVPPSGRMPQNGYYFDAIVRQPPIDDGALCIEDNLEEFQFLTTEELAHYAFEVNRLYSQTDKAIMLNMGGTGFGDIALVPAPQLKNPKGIREIEEWYISMVTRQGYIEQVFERQCEIALENLTRLHQAVEEKVAAIFLSGTDFGGQKSLLISPRVYRTLYMPFQKKINDWVHQHTTWKTFMHSDGAIRELIPDFITAGFDILNPVQWTAAGLDPREIKNTFGNQTVFWGAGIDTQGVLPFGLPEDVRKQTREYLELFKQGGGFVFSSVHNIQARVPIENILGFYETYQKYCNYS
jgi:hypothetical protein